MGAMPDFHFQEGELAALADALAPLVADRLAFTNTAAEADATAVELARINADAEVEIARIDAEAEVASAEAVAEALTTAAVAEAEADVAEAEALTDVAALAGVDADAVVVDDYDDDDDVDQADDEPADDVAPVVDDAPRPSHWMHRRWFNGGER